MVHGVWGLVCALCSCVQCGTWIALHIHTSRREKGSCGTPEAELGVLGKWQQGPVTTKTNANFTSLKTLLKGAPCWQGAPEAPDSCWALSQAPVLGSNTLVAGQTLYVSDLRVVCPSFLPSV